jgi:hypothetical protein
MNKPGLFVVMLILANAFSRPAAAHEEGIYESLEHIHLGRVFLSPEERAYLDKHRGVRAPVAASNSTGQKAAAARISNAAGYIMSSSGRARVWKDGDFVSAKIPDSIRFPGDVKVTRTADKLPANNDTTAVDEESRAVGVADDAE